MGSEYMEIEEQTEDMLVSPDIINAMVSNSNINRINIATANGEITAVKKRCDVLERSRVLVTGLGYAGATANSFLKYAEVSDSHSAYDATTGLFTCPRAGLYIISASTYFSTAGNRYISVNGASGGRIITRAASQNDILNAVVSLAAGDVVGIMTVVAATAQTSLPLIIAEL